MTLKVRCRTGCSFVVSDLREFTAWLRAQGFIDIPVRNVTEFARLERDGALIVCYEPGTVLCQGRRQQEAIALVKTLPPFDDERVQLSLF